MSLNPRIGFILLMVCVPLFWLSGCSATPEADAVQKIKITKLDELPQHTYPADVKVSELLESREKLCVLAEALRKDVEGDLAKYAIDDPTTLQNMHGTLMTIDLFEENYEDALKRMEQIRALESKESKKLTTGLETRAFIAALKEVDRKADPEAFAKAYARELAARTGKLPWELVQDQIKQNKGRAEIMSANLLRGMVQGQMDPVVAQTGELSAEMAGGVIGMYTLIHERLPLNPETVAVYQKLIDSHTSVKADIWAARSVTLDAKKSMAPVRMAVWDSGTDVAIFKDQLFVNANEKMNGLDDDGNGFIDDVHGIAYDIHARPAEGLLYPLGDAESRMADVMKFMKGFMDIQASLDTPEASELKKHLSTVDPGKVKGFMEDLSLAGNYCHGTHVAGLMLDGNPFGELLVGRLSYDHRIPPVVRDVEWGKRDAAKCEAMVGYYKAHGVRVVNMSWGEAMADAEGSLEQNGIGASAEERRAIARKVFSLQKDGLEEAIRNAPEILFICAAGNSDNDVEFDEFIPSCFDLPNLLVVGAVDQAGDPTGFTSFGSTVEVYASGFEVDSYVPGGVRMKMSGTSMASPNVANLAGKLLAANPKLSPPEVINLIKRGSDERKAGDSTFLLMNPKQSMELLR